MVKVILIEVMLCVKWYRADLLKTWMSSPINFQSILHRSSFFCLLCNIIHKMYVSCKANLPAFSYVTSPYIPWPSASHFQSTEKPEKSQNPAPAINSYLFANARPGHFLLRLSGFSVHCTAVRASSHSRGKNCTWKKGCEPYKDHMAEWNKIIVYELFNCSWMCL